jgi:hypothetical protein
MRPGRPPKPRPSTIPPAERRPEDWEALEEVDPAALINLEGRIARRVARYEMCGPMVLLLESMKPLSFIASQALVVAQPAVQSVLELKDYYTFRKLLEDRSRLEDLVRAIEVEEEKRLARIHAKRDRLADSRRVAASYAAWLAGRTLGDRGKRDGLAEHPRA